MGVKWNQDAKPAEKLLTMYSMLLFGHREISLSEFSRELGCSKQAVGRLLDQLEAARFGKVLREKRGREAVYHLERPRTLPKISLNREGLQQLALCRDFLRHLLPPLVRKDINTTLQQASAYLPEEQEEKERPCGSSLFKGSIDYAPFQSQFHTLTRAIALEKVCNVHYKARWNAAAKEHAFAPKKLVAYHEALYIHGWMVTKEGRAEALYKKVTPLALQRIEKAVMTRRSAASLPEVPESGADDFGVMDREACAVRIFFSPAVATYIAERHWSRDQRFTTGQDGSLVLDMSARSPDEVIAWVLSFGPEAKLIEPLWLRDKLCRRLKETAENYE